MRHITTTALALLVMGCSSELTPSEESVCESAYAIGYDDGSECLERDQSLPDKTSGLAQTCYDDGYDWAYELYECGI